jgi:drug/metabolite transporter (DMT)-like permease
MNRRPTPFEWFLFLALAVTWGSSYLFIKIAVPSFGIFSLVASRLIIGAIFLWIVIRLAHQELPRERRIYGHLLVMAVINIVIPFALITWAEQSVQSSVAAILVSAVPLFAIVIAPLVLPDEPIRLNGVVGLLIGFVGVVVLTSRGLLSGGGSSDISGEVALLGASLAYAAGAVYSRKNMRGVRPMIPAVFQVTFAAIIATSLAFLTEHPLDLRPAPDALFAIVWLGILGSGLAYLINFRLLAAWGATRTTLVAYLIPVVGIVLGYVVLGETVDGRLLLGTALVVGGVAIVNSRWGRRRLFGRTPAESGASPAPTPSAAVAAPVPDVKPAEPAAG